MRRTVFHRPVPGSRGPGWSATCGHQFADGRFCGGGVYLARNGNHQDYHWRHFPHDAMRRRIDALPEAWRPIVPSS